MKVTEEMIVTASQRYADRTGRVIASGDVRAALEAALADVPEPSHTVLELNKRNTELQQRLERVRAWRNDDSKGGYDLPQCCELDDILEGKT